jgi:hypothetical protein
MFRFISRSALIILITITTAYSFEPLFYSRSDYQMSNYIQSMTSADFNNDGFVDFACGGKTSGPVNIFLNMGDGTYMDPIAVETGTRLTSTNHGDFNGDGWIDLVTVTNNNNDINIIMNQGGGTFIQQQTFTGLYVQSFTVMDMNNDGYDDILRMYGFELDLLFSNGDGTFAMSEAGEPVFTLQMDISSGSLLPFDVNHDAYEDLIIWGSKRVYTDSVNSYSQPVLVTYVNNGDSTFQSGVEYLHGSSIDDYLQDIATGNFDSDAEIDLLITDRQNNRTILTNNGDGSFSPVKSFVNHYSNPVNCGDVNGDDFSDIIISDSENASVSIMLNNGSDDISFADPIDYSGKWGTNPTFIKKLFSTDVNNDSYDDIILYDWTLSTIFSYGDGSFPIHNTIEDMGIAAFDLLADDFNGDGFTDLMTLDGYVYLKYSDGQGGFTNRQKMSSGLADARGIFSGDFNADEIIDFGVTGTNGLSLFYGLETGGFQGRPLSGDLGFIAGYDGMAADFNDDGFMDFATYYSGSLDLNIVLSDSNGEYHTDSYNLTGTLQTGIAAADIDGDNDLDIVVSGYHNATPGGPGIINVNYNDGNGQFSTGPFIETEFMAMGVVLEDLNDDGYPDLAATQYGTYDGYVSVYLNNQDGTFPTQVNYAQLYAPAYRDITAADMDNDGDMDLLASIEMYDDIAVLMNSGDGSFPEVQYYAGGDNIKAFTIAHLDSGSTMDLAVTSSAPNRDFVYLFLNTGLDLLPPPVIDNLPEVTIPFGYILEQNYPNPFNPSTAIGYRLSAVSFVNLTIYNALGQKIKTLVHEQQSAGTYQVKWDASGFASGMYFYKLETPANVMVRKMLLIK